MKAGEVGAVRTVGFDFDSDTDFDAYFAAATRPRR